MRGEALESVAKWIKPARPTIDVRIDDLGQNEPSHGPNLVSPRPDLPGDSLLLSASFNNAIEAVNMFSRVKAYLHVDYKPGERRLVQKIDFFILTFCCLSYLVNYVRCPSLTALMCS
jgi:hypothetical protein